MLDHARLARDSIAGMTHRRLWFALLLAVVLALGGAISAAALNLTHNFELDKNAVDDLGTTDDDWNTLFDGSNTPPTAELAKIFVPDYEALPDLTYFTGGGSKDDLDISSWLWTTGDQAPDKDDITDAYAAAYINPTAHGDNQVGDFIIYFGADRLASNGDAQMGFWFFRNQVGRNGVGGSGGTFSGVHAIGDLLLLTNFTGGGGTTTVRVYEWVGSGGSDGTIDLLFEGVDCATGAHSIACATVNSSSTPSPWAYTPKQGPSGAFPAGSFLEGGLNVSAALRASGQSDQGVCFTSFLAETRSSQSVDAQLKDFALGDLNACGSLTVTKSANPSFTRTFGWTIDKSVTPETWDLFTGDSGTSRYTIALNKDAGTDSNWAVSGNITVQNTGLTTATITGVSDSLTGGITAAISCPVSFPHNLAKNATITCSYSASLPDATARTNTATATTSGPVAGNSGTAAVTFGAPTTLVNDSVNVDDTFASGDAGPFSDDASYNYNRTFTCDADEGTHNNTATIVETNQSDSASVTVNCHALTVTKDASTSLTRTFNWTIDKSVTPDTWNLFTGDSGTSRYTIALDKTGFTDSNWAVSGNIAVANPAPIAATINSVSDIVSPAIAASVSGATFPYTLAAGGTLNLTYSAALPDAASRTNTATATLQNYAYNYLGAGTASGTTNWTGSANVSFASPTVTSVNASVNVDDTFAAGDAGPFSDDASYNYNRTFTCDADEGTHNNTATIVETGQSDSASVTVNCHALTVTKNANTSLTRTWTWTIDKSADQSSATLTQNQQLVVNYTVVVNATSADSAWGVAGSIAVANPAPIAATINSVSDLVSPNIAASVNCGVTFPYSLAAGGTLNCTYSASLPDATNRTNTATATLQNHAYDYLGAGTATGTTNWTGSANVSFASATVNQIDECINVTDTYAGALGTVCAADGLPRTFTYTRTLQYTAAQCGPQTAPNTATFVTNDTGATGSDNWTVNVTVVCAEGFTPGYWKNHLEQWAATGFSPNQTLESVFDVPDAYGLDNVTLVDALSFPGGSDTVGAAQTLLRAAVAALLNSAHPNVDYPLTTAQVISQVNAALATGDRATMLSLASQLDAYNNLGGSI